MQRAIASLALVCTGFLGCGSDDKKDGEPCPEGVEVGAMLPCTCGDGGQSGMQSCQEGKTLSDCDCTGGGGMMSGTGGASTGTGGMGSTATGGTGTGGSPAGTGGTPSTGTDAGMGMGDPGMPPGTGGMMAAPLPMDGNQGAVCTDGTDCNMGLDCYTTGGGIDFCSTVCDADEDCMGLAGAMWTCSMTVGACQVECMGADDTESCPDGMVCLSTSGSFPGGQGGGGTFRCKYPMESVMTEGFTECMGDMDCAEGLECTGNLVAGSAGFCSASCMDDMDCEGLSVPSGTIMPSCELTGPMASSCVLVCADAPEGCPEGMQCATLGPVQRCIYQ